MNAKLMGDVKRQTIDLAETMWKAIAARYDSNAPGLRAMTDLEHRVWFEGMVARDPNWPMALAFVEGGPKEIGRYLRTVEREQAQEQQWVLGVF